MDTQQNTGVVASLPIHRVDDAARPLSTTLLSREPGIPRDPYSRQVPLAYRIESFADARGLHFVFFLRPERRGDRPFYAPQTPGGWQFQTFLNVDQDLSTGYYDGYEFLTRDSEPGLERNRLILRHTEGGGGPGGWGEEVARIPVLVTPRFMTFTIPLEAIGDDGLVNFGIEMYATVLGGEDGQTPVASYVRSYAGSSRLRTRRGITDALATSEIIPSD